MKKIISKVLTSVAVAAMLISSVQAADLTDLLVKHRQFITAEEEGYEEFLIISYGNDTDKLMSCSDEIHFGKDANDLEYYETLDPDTVIEGFSKGEGNIYFVEETDDFYRVVFYFGELDKPANLRVAIDCGILTSEQEIGDNNYLLATGICDSALAMGYQEIGLLDIANYDLMYTVEK